MAPGLLLAGLVAGVGLGVAGCSSGSTPAAAPAPTPSPTDTYGGYPSFLPRGTTGSSFGHRVVDASAHDPALATQGDTVRVHVGATSVLAQVSGPAVPVSGQAYQAPTSPATFQVVLRGATHPLRVDPSTFQAIDETGTVHDLQPQGHVPRVLLPGRTARFALFSPAFETGEGRLRWIPVGHLAPVEWDFVVETD